jgi:tetrahydromethanopterin S-methyltransferase subunit F
MAALGFLESDHVWSIEESVNLLERGGSENSGLVAARDQFIAFGFVFESKFFLFWVWWFVFGE